MNNKEKSYYANITKHLNSVYKSVELEKLGFIRSAILWLKEW